jgi:dienelactone hydrolase
MYYTSLEYYVRLFETGKREFAYSADTQEEYRIWKKQLSARLCEISGINRCILCNHEHRYLYTETIEGLTAEYHVIETEPGIRMPFYLLWPQEKQEKLSILIIPHGHGGGKKQMLEYMGDFIRESLKNGFLVACPDERGSGDRREFTEQGDSVEQERGNSHRELLQVGIGFGKSVIGTAVWDLMRLADYLLALPQTGDFLACAGMSGGGQQTLWFAALDERVSAAVTSGYFYGMKESLIELPHNCACNFVPFLFETADMGDIGALIAPRPLFIESGEKDPLNGKSGLENVLSQIEVTKRAYRLFGAGNQIVHFVHPGGHQWVGNGVQEFLLNASKHTCLDVGI